MGQEQGASPPKKTYTISLPVKVKGPQDERVEGAANRKVAETTVNFEVQANSKEEALAKVSYALTRAIVTAH